VAPRHVDEGLVGSVDGFGPHADGSAGGCFEDVGSPATVESRQVEGRQPGLASELQRDRGGDFGDATRPGGRGHAPFADRLDMEPLVVRRCDDDGLREVVGTLVFLLDGEQSPAAVPPAERPVLGPGAPSPGRSASPT
jgi:hypothetical protein